LATPSEHLQDRIEHFVQCLAHVLGENAQHEVSTRSTAEFAGNGRISMSSTRGARVVMTVRGIEMQTNVAGPGSMMVLGSAFEVNTPPPGSTRASRPSCDTTRRPVCWI
jgi:hypothetical protein